jgi:hypothetical protein
MDELIMPMEHLDEQGRLCQGYYCPRCGGGTGMYGHRNQDCEPNPEKVKKMNAINKAGSLEAYVFSKLKATS